MCSGTGIWAGIFVQLSRLGEERAWMSPWFVPHGGAVARGVWVLHQGLRELSAPLGQLSQDRQDSSRVSSEPCSVPVGWGHLCSTAGHGAGAQPLQDRLDMSWTLSPRCCRYQAVPQPREASPGSSVHSRALASPPTGSSSQADPLQPHGEGPAGQGAPGTAPWDSRCWSHKHLGTNSARVSHHLCLLCTATSH